MVTTSLSFEVLDNLRDGRLRTVDVPCELCSTQVSARGARRNVFRLYGEAQNFIGFACARCDAKGFATSGVASARPSPERLAAIRCDAAQRQAVEHAASLRKARWLWSARVPITLASPPSIYLRERRRYRGRIIPALLGYLPARGEHEHAMIAAFGIATEPEPGVIAIADDAVVGVHLTKLNADGSDTEPNKITIGKGTAGFPICLAPPNDLLALAVTEGIEDALSVHEATGLGAWAAGSAGRMPALAAHVPAYIECVTIAAHSDPDGEKGALGLAATLEARGVETRIQGLSS